MAIKIEVRGGDTPDLPLISGADVTFESESGIRYQVTSDAEGKAELTLPAIPVITPTGSERCAAYRVTVSAPPYQTEVIERMYMSPWAGTIYFHPTLPKGEGIWRVTEASAKCIPDQKPGS